MPFQFTFRNVDISPALREYSQEQLERVGKFLLKESRWHIYYSMSRHECQVDVVVAGPWGTYKASNGAPDFYAALDGAAEKLGKQFHKAKDKHQKHHKPERSRKAKLERVNDQLEYDNRPFYRKPA